MIKKLWSAILAVFSLGQLTARAQSPVPVTTPTSSVPISSILHQMDPALMGAAIVGALVSLIGSSVFMYYMNDKHFKREKERELVEKRLEKLYSPLYTFTKDLDAYDDQVLSLRSPEEWSRINVLIGKNYYLANKEFQPLLSNLLWHILVPGGWPNEPEDMAKIFERIEKDYNNLQKEYFSLNQDSLIKKISKVLKFR